MMTPSASGTNLEGDERMNAKGMNPTTVRSTGAAGWPRAWLVSIPVMLWLTACASNTTNPDVVVDRPAAQGSGQVSADNVFDTADGDADGSLLPLDVERLGLGGDWHTLDADGSGRISRQEFRDQFASPLIQSTLRLPGDAQRAQPLVSSDFLLPPEPPAQRYVPAPIEAVPPASVTMPTDAPLTIPVLVEDQDAAAIDQAASEAAESDGDEASVPVN